MRWARRHLFGASTPVAKALGGLLYLGSGVGLAVRRAPWPISRRAVRRCGVAIVGFGEPVTLALLAAAALVVAGTAPHLTEQHQRVQVHEPMVHEHWHRHG